MYNTIERLCTKKGITVAKMCSDIGIRNSIMTDLKKGRTKNLSTKTVTLIADYFGISVDYLLGKSKYIVDDALLDIVNGIDSDILEICRGNLLIAKEWQKDRDISKQCKNHSFTVSTSHLVDLMKEYGISQEQISRKFNVSHSLIENFFDIKTYNFKLTTWLDLADCFNISIDSLFGRDEFIQADLFDDEKELLAAYRSNPDMQSAVNRLLGIAPGEQESKKGNAV